MGAIKVLVTPVAGNVPTAYDLAPGPPLVSDSRWTLADPQVVEYRQGRVKSAADSPAVRLGIQAIDVSHAGLEEGPGDSPPKTERRYPGTEQKQD